MNGDNYIITLIAVQYLHDDQTDGDLHNDYTLIFKFTYGNI